MDKQLQTELEAATFRRLLQHLQQHTEAQNIDLMILADFCRNCLAKWYVAAAEDQGVALDYEAAREIVYGMPYQDWKNLYQTEATPEQLAAFEHKQQAKQTTNVNLVNELPKKTCSIDRLVTQPKLVTAAKSGSKTQQRRDGVYAWPGEVFELEGIQFIVTDLYRQRLGDMTDEDAQAEGFQSLEQYKDIILKMHNGMTWNEDGLVWVHCFVQQAD